MGEPKELGSYNPLASLLENSSKEPKPPGQLNPSDIIEAKSAADRLKILMEPPEAGHVKPAESAKNTKSTIRIDGDRVFLKLDLNTDEETEVEKKYGYYLFPITEGMDLSSLPLKMDALFFTNLHNANGLILPPHIKYLWMKAIKSAQGLVLPDDLKYVAFDSLESVDSLVIPSKKVTVYLPEKLRGSLNDSHYRDQQSVPEAAEPAPPLEPVLPPTPPEPAPPLEPVLPPTPQEPADAEPAPSAITDSRFLKALERLNAIMVSKEEGIRGFWESVVQNRRELLKVLGLAALIGSGAGVGIGAIKYYLTREPAPDAPAEPGPEAISEASKLAEQALIDSLRPVEGKYGFSTREGYNGLYYSNGDRLYFYSMDPELQIQAHELNTDPKEWRNVTLREKADILGAYCDAEFKQEEADHALRYEGPKGTYLAFSDSWVFIPNKDSKLLAQQLAYGDHPGTGWKALHPGQEEAIKSQYNIK